MKYIILIPAYEPDEKLIELLSSIDEEINVIVVNDGSGKEYNKVFKEAKKYAHIISYEKNMGKGYALKQGLSYIKKRFNDYVVITIDSDGQHRIDDALKLGKYAGIYKDILVLGKRMWDKKTPLRSRFGNAITRFVFHKMTGISIYDTQTGLRAFSYKLIDYMLDNPGNRYEYEMNVLLNLKNSGIRYHEIPIETIYIDNNKKSHFKTIKDSYKIYNNIFKWKHKKLD